MEQEKLRAFVYDRVSRILNGRVITSTDDQNADNEDLCDAHGWELVARFTDPGRGASRHSKKRRLDYERMIERIKRGECDVLVYWEASRAYRDLKIYVELRELCIKHRMLLCYNGDIFDMTRSADRRRTAQDAIDAESEADKIRERCLRTTRRNAQRGRPHGKIPYGYRRIYDSDTGVLLEQVPREDQAAVVVEIAKRAVGGESLMKIAAELNARGIPGPTGGPWSSDIMPALLTKPTYIGKRQYQGEVIGDATWDGILDEEIYYACVAKFSDPARYMSKTNAVKWLLSGIAKCSICKGKHRVRPAHGVLRYTCVTSGCFKTAIQLAQFDDIVTLAVLQHIERPEFVDALLQTSDDDASRAALAEAQALEAQLAEARELAGRWNKRSRRMELSAASLAKMENELLPLIEGARERARSTSVPHVLRNIAGPHVREYWAEKEDDVVWRRAVVSSVVVPWVNPAGQGARSIKPGRFTLEWLY
jgi:site-specific DNA recombinase